MAKKQNKHAYTSKQLDHGMAKLRRYYEWRESNPRAYAYGVRMALDAVASGHHIGGQAVIEAIRGRDFTDEHGKPTRTNNDYAPIIARELLRKHPHMAGRIELRASVFDVLLPASACDSNTEVA